MLSVFFFTLNYYESSIFGTLYYIQQHADSVDMGSFPTFSSVMVIESLYSTGQLHYVSPRLSCGLLM